MNPLVAVLLVQAWMPPADRTGMLNPLVTQDTIQKTICVSGWAASQRPPLSYTSKLKRQWLPAGRRMSDYELDHLIPLSLGGAPRDPANLWLEPWADACGAGVKDDLERKLHHLVCAGDVSLSDAQVAIADDWTVAYSRWVGPLPGCGR